MRKLYIKPLRLCSIIYIYCKGLHVLGTHANVFDDSPTLRTTDILAAVCHTQCQMFAAVTLVAAKIRGICYCCWHSLSVFMVHGASFLTRSTADLPTECARPAISIRRYTHTERASAICYFLIRQKRLEKPHFLLLLYRRTDKVTHLLRCSYCSVVC